MGQENSPKDKKSRSANNEASKEASGNATESMSCEEERVQNQTTSVEKREQESTSVDMLKKGDVSDYMASAGSQRLQNLRGFDEEYTDIVDYIVRSTHKIWEEYGMGLLYTHYSDNCVVHTPDGLTYGREEMLTQSILKLSAFPDRKVYPEDVIWTGNDQDGFHTSHRNTAVGHHSGYSIYGPPTGRKITRRGIANCFVRENKIREEWVVQDAGAIVRQLGLDAFEFADRLVAENERRGRKLGYGDNERLIGQTSPAQTPPAPTKESTVEDFVASSLDEIWNWRRFDKITDYFAQNYLCYTSPDRTLYGRGDYRAYVISFIAAFPDAKLNIDQIYSIGNSKEGYRVAVRWTLLGTHEGPSYYGYPTGKPVNIMGITHYSVRGGKFLNETTVFDELAMLVQLRS